MRRSFRSALFCSAVILATVLVLKGSSLLISSGTWQATGNLSSARSGASAALLQDGRILVTGGNDSSGPAATVDFFNADGTASAAPPMVNPRSSHVSVMLQDGRVLVAGGITTGGNATSTAEIFDPVANTWTNAGSGLNEARSNATAAVLQDGRVLIAGGQNGTLTSSTIEVFDPSKGGFTVAGMMSSPRTKQAMTVLLDGRVLIVGGFNGTIPVASTDIFDPVAGTVSAGPKLSFARSGHSATTLLNGVVVVIGGNDGNPDPTQSDLTPAEAIDFTASTPAFTTLAANLATPREGHLAILLPNNNSVLIAGGTSAGTAVTSAELFTAQVSSTGVWTYGFATTGSMTTPRSAAAASANQMNAPSTTMQRNGVVAVAGGSDANRNPLNTTEAYGYPTVQTDQSDYPPGTTVTITGSGFQPGETVALQLVESPLIDTHGPYTIVADANGNISDSSFVTDSHDANIRFYLTAAGTTSGFQAQNTFTDAPPATVNFATTGLPSGASVTVTASFTNNGGQLKNNQSIPFSAPGPGGNTATTPGTSFTYSFPASITVGGTTYTLASSSPASPFNTPASGNTTTVTATYESVSATNSSVVASPASVPADGVTTSTVTVTLKDTSGNPVGGKTVTLTPSGGSSVITTVSGTTNTSGQATFTVKDSTVENVTYTGKDTTDNITVTQTATVSFSNVTTTTSLSPSSNPSTYGQSVTFTAKIAPASGSTSPTGSVQFKVDSVNSGSPVTVSSCSPSPDVCATFTTATLSATSHNIEADFTGTGVFTGSSNTLNQTVNKADTLSTTTSSVNPSVFGQSVTFTATVTAVAPGSGTPTGSVQFKDGGTPIGSPQPLNASGQATFATSSLSVATHSITAVYGGDGNFNGSGMGASTDPALSQVVNKADTLSTTTSSVNPSVFGQSVTFTATVTAVAPGSGTPTGSVQFKDGGTPIGSPQALNASGQATFATSSLSVATHSITAVYGGDGNFNGSGMGASTDPALSQVVNKADTLSTTTSSVNPSVFGQSVTFTATVTAMAPGSGTPTGSVQFKDGGTPIGSPQALNASGQATFATSSLSVATHSITAVYGGDGNFNGSGMGASTDPALSQVVNKADTLSTTTSSVTPSVFGQSVTFTATVTAVAPGSGTPTGSVQFKDGGTPIGSPQALNASGQATFATSSLSVATHSITAVYGGDGNFNGSGMGASTDPALSQVVNKADTLSTTTSSVNPSVFGQSVTFTATVTAVAPGSGTPTGSVQFKDGGTPIGSPQALNASGQATFATSSLSVTTHSITAVYSGDGNFNGSGMGASTDPALSQVVNKADTLSTTTSSVNPSVFGQSVTFTATVTAVAPGSGTPSGSVQFEDGGTPIGSPQSLNASGQAAFSTSSLSVTTHSITAVYSGDANFNGSGMGASTDPALSQVVNKADTLSTTTSSVTPSVFGQSVTFTATVTVVAPGSGTPTGSIQFKDGGTPIGSPQPLNASGQATFATSSLSVATHSITAVYSGDANFNGSGMGASTDPALSQVVNKADTLSTTTSSVTPSVFGQSVTFTATVTVVAPGSGAPTGSVQFEDGGTPIGSPQPLNASGQATFATSSLSVATHSITAAYSGDGNFNGSGMGASTAPIFSQTVNKADTTTSISSVSPEPSVTGQSYTVSWSVTVNAPGSGTPTGTVSVSDGTGGSCSAAVAAGSCSLTSTTAGNKTVTASYSGDADFNMSSGTASHTVNKADTTTSISSVSPEPTVTGQAYTVSWSVTVNAPGSGTPTGTVSVSDGTGGSCSAMVGAGSCSFASTSAGVKTISASYGGDSNFNGSSGTASHTVNKANTTTTISGISPEPSVTGQSYTVSWSVTVNAPGSGTPTGMVSISDGTGGSCSAPAGAGSCLFASTSAGTKTITASYAGDANFNGSATTASHTVNKASTMTTLGSSPNPSELGQSVTLTATVSVVSPGAGAPSGTVSFYDGATLLGTGTVTSGTATLATSGLTVGSHTLTATYGGDSNFLGSTTSTGVSQQVNYGFLGLESPYAPPPTTFNVTRTMPLKWQYTNASGTVVNSATANPVVLIQGPYACGGTDSAGDITVNDAGASGYQYDPTTNTWQFNWQIKGNAPGCYDIYIKSQQSGQTNGAFPISVVSH